MSFELFAALYMYISAGNLECNWSNSQDFFEKQKIKEDKFLWVSFVIFLILRAEECIQYASMQHVNSVWIMHVSLTCFWTFFSICKTNKVTFSISFSTYKKNFLQKWLFIFITCPGVRWILYTHVLGWSLGGINQSF